MTADDPGATSDRSRSRLGRKLATAGGMVAGITSLAGCSGGSSDSPDEGGAEPGDEQGDAEANSEQGDAGTDDAGRESADATTTTSESASLVDAFGDVSFDENGAMFVSLKEDVELDVVVLNGPFGTRAGKDEPAERETTAKFELIGQNEVMYTPGVYTVRGYRKPDETAEESEAGYQQVAVKEVPLEPDPEIATVKPAEENETMTVVVRNAGTGPFPVTEYRVSDPSYTQSRDNWRTTDDLFALPNSPAELVVDTYTGREIDDDVSESEANEKYCNGETVEKLLEVRATHESRLTARTQMTIALRGEAVVDKGWGTDQVYCTKLEEAKSDS